MMTLQGSYLNVQGIWNAGPWSRQEEIFDPRLGRVYAPSQLEPLQKTDPQPFIFPCDYRVKVSQGGFLRQEH